MRVVTKQDQALINRLYAELHTYAAVARQTGFSPATVKKYVIDGYIPPEDMNIVRFDRPLPEFDDSMFRATAKDWGSLCELSETEVNEITELWNEIEV